MAESQMEDLLTALFNSTAWILACGQQDRQRQYELIFSVLTAAVEAEREACALIADKHEREWRALIRPGDNQLGVSTTYNSASEARAIAIDIRARGKDVTQ